MKTTLTKQHFQLLGKKSRGDMSNEVKLDVDELKKILETYHNKECWTKIQKWFEPFQSDNTKRAKFFAKIMYTQDVLTAENTNNVIGSFNVLQGDVIKTKSANTFNPIIKDYNPLEYNYYVVIPSSCSVQPNRYKWVLLARLSPVEPLNDGKRKSIYESVLKFKNGKIFYLPPIKGVQEGALGFYGLFEEISYIENNRLQSSSRVASLSEIGWYLLNAFIVNHLTRPPKNENKARTTNHPAKWCIK